MQAKIIAKKVLMMPTNQFDRYAISYSQNRDIQQKIAKRLLSKIDLKKYKKIIDIGCGDGVLFEEAECRPELFLGVDASPNMCALHSRRDGCVVECMDFDGSGLADCIVAKYGKFDIMLSSSALQWSKGLDSFLSQASCFSSDFAISIFTRGTFTSVREFLGIDSFLPLTQDIKRSFAGFDVKSFSVESYEREFASSKDAIHFIKTTGVSGGQNKISYHEAKRLYESGPKKLEFEVVYIVGSFEKSDFSIS